MTVATAKPPAPVAADTAIRPFAIAIPEEELRSSPADGRDPPAAGRPESHRRACSSRRCRSSPATGRRNTTGARSRRGSTRCRSSSPRSTGSTSISSHALEHENAMPLIVTHGCPARSSSSSSRRSADQSDGAWRAGNGRLRRRHSVDAGLWVSASRRRRMDPRVSRAPDRADATPRLYPFRGAGRRLGRAGHRPMGVQGAPEFLGIHTNMPGVVPPICKARWRPAPAGLPPR